MTKTYSLPATMLKAALYCASKADVRFYLNGVLVEPSKGRVVATNGAILFCGEAPKGDFPSLIIPRETLELAFKTLGKKGIERSNIELQQDDYFRLITLSSTMAFTPIDGTFPEYERVIPQAVSGEVAHFDPDLLCDGRDALATYACKPSMRGFPLTHNGNGPAVLSEEGINALVVVMPMRAGEPSSNAWYWPPKKVRAA